MYFEVLSFRISNHCIESGIGYCWIIGEEATPIDHILNEIKQALANHMFYIAISATLTLPDICVSLISKDGRSDGERYAKWCDAYLNSGFTYISGKDLWSLRCGVVHNARMGDLKHNVAKVIFSTSRNFRFSNCLFNDSYIYDAEEFCLNFIKHVKKWYKIHENDTLLKANINRLVKYHQDGLPPYFLGTTCIA